MPTLKRVYNIIRYGLGSRARERKQAAKAAARQAKFESGLWQHGEAFAQRTYSSYDEYVIHQTAKLDKIIDRLRETETEDLAEFQKRFKGCPALPEVRSVLCLGARLGTEVKALHSLGYFAVGVDLNPGLENPYVLPGDFHKLVFADGSVDAVYTNALDHAFDLATIVSEVWRLLRADGLFIVDLLPGYEEGFIPGAFEATYWRNADTLIKKILELSSFSLDEIRDLGQHRRDRWMQALFRKTV